MILIRRVDSDKPVPPDCILDALGRLIEAAPEAMRADYATHGQDPRNHASFRMDGGVLLTRTEWDARGSGLFDRTFELKGRGEPVRMVLMGCSRSGTDFGVADARRSIVGMGRVAADVLKASSTAVDHVTAELRDIAHLAMLESDDLLCDAIRRRGAVPPARRTTTLTTATPWTRAAVGMHDGSVRRDAPTLASLPRITSFTAGYRGMGAPTTIVMPLWSETMSTDAASWTAIDRLRLEASLRPGEAA